MGVSVDQPASQSSVRAGQFTLDCVLGKDGDRLLTERPVPGELLGLDDIANDGYLIIFSKIVWILNNATWMNPYQLVSVKKFEINCLDW